MGDELERKLNEMENKDEVLRKLRAELAKAARALSGSCARPLAASLRCGQETGEAGRERSQRTGDEGQASRSR